METTVDINALRNGIIRDLKETKSLGMLEWFREMMDRVKETEKEEHLKPYTKDEINAWLDEAEAQAAAGGGTPMAEFREKMKRRHPELCGWI